MRPYQIAATEVIINKNSKWYQILIRLVVKINRVVIFDTQLDCGKTLTSFKVTQEAAKLDEVDKVIFVVDRKDLDYQTQNEYENSKRISFS